MLGGGVLPIMPHTGGSAQPKKGYPFYGLMDMKLLRFHKLWGMGGKGNCHFGL